MGIGRMMGVLSYIKQYGSCYTVICGGNYAIWAKT